LNFGATTTETNFKEYKIFYKIADGSAPGIPSSWSARVMLLCKSFCQPVIACIRCKVLK